MKIEKFKKLKGKKYEIFLENNTSIITYEDILINNNLLISKNINDINIILEENKKYEVLEVAKKYLDKKMCSIKDMRNYLSKKGFDDKLIDNTINYLIKYNFLNDNIYVKSYSNDKIRFTNDGPNKIINDLIKKGIDKNIIDDNIEFDFKYIYDKLNKLIDKKIKSTKNYSGNILKIKITNYLVNLGYDRRMIEEILLKKDLNNINDGIKEYDKLYNKYKTKLEGVALENIIRQKLYLKGFNYDEIKKARDFK